MKKILVINVTYDHKLYNFFDYIKNIICYKENLPIYNLYNGKISNRYLLHNDIVYKNSLNSANILNDFNPASYEVRSIHEMFEKFYYFFKNNEHLLSKYDYILRCNSSTFLNFKKLKEVIAQLPLTNCFAGRILNPELINGTCIVFSKDVLKTLINTPLKNIPYANTYDDVAIGKLLAGEYKIPTIHIPQYDYSNGIIPDTKEVISSLQYPLIRIRNNNDRENIDTEIWRRLFVNY